MSAAHLAGPPVPSIRTRFVSGCTGRPRHTRAEAVAVIMRRGSGLALRCPCCGGWHTALPSRASLPKCLSTTKGSDP